MKSAGIYLTIKYDCVFFYLRAVATANALIWNEMDVVDVLAFSRRPSIEILFRQSAAKVPV